MERNETGVNIENDAKKIILFIYLFLLNIRVIVTG